MFRAAFLDAPKPTITGRWKLSPLKAHVAFDNMVVIQGTATATITTSAVITIPPTPVAGSKELIKLIKTLPVDQMDTASRIYNQTICRESEFRHIINETKCVAVYPATSPIHSYEQFAFMISEFGNSCTGPNGTVCPICKKGVVAEKSQCIPRGVIYDDEPLNMDFNWNELNLIDTPRLLEEIYEATIGQKYEPVMGICGRVDPHWASKHNTSRYAEPFHLPICFFSKRQPHYPRHRAMALPIEGDECDEGNDTYAAVVTYSWWEDNTSTAQTRALRAIAQSDKDLAYMEDCELMNEIPEQLMQPPKILRPISGRVLAGPDMNNQRQQPSGEAAHVQDSPNEGSTSIPSPENSNHISPAGGSIEGASAPGDTAQANEYGNPGLSSIPLPAISVGSQQQQPTYVGGSRPVVIIGTKSISLNGPAATINGETVSLASQALIVGTKTVSIATEILVSGSGISITLGTEQATVRKGLANQNLIIIGSSTVTAFGSEYTTAGHKVQFGQNSLIVDDTSTYQFTAAFGTMPVQADSRIKGEQASNIADGAINPTAQISKVTGDILTYSSSHDMAKPSSESRKQNIGTCGRGNQPMLVGIVGVVVLYTLLS